MKNIVDTLRSPVMALYEHEADGGAILRKAADEIERLRAEVQEQARLNGMGAERELSLQAKITALTSLKCWYQEHMFAANRELTAAAAREERLREALGSLLSDGICQPVYPSQIAAVNEARAALAETEKTNG